LIKGGRHTEEKKKKGSAKRGVSWQDLQEKGNGKARSKNKGGGARGKGGVGASSSEKEFSPSIQQKRGKRPGRIKEEGGK